MADYTPTLGDFTELKPFRFWCQKVLPLVYDDSLSYYELLCKVVDYLNKTMEDVDTMHDDVVNLHSAYVQLQTYVNTYFDNLDVQEEINNKLDAMAQDGSLSTLISPFIPDLVSDWLDEHITPTSPAIDNTLTVSGAAADAKVTGDEISNLKINVKQSAKMIGESYRNVIQNALLLSDGTTETSTNYVTTDFIETSADKQLIIEKETAQGSQFTCVYCLYDSNKAFIAESYYNGNVKQKLLVPVTSGTRYVRFSYSKTVDAAGISIYYKDSVINTEKAARSALDAFNAMELSFDDFEVGTLNGQGLPIEGENRRLRTINYIPVKPDTTYYLRVEKSEYAEANSYGTLLWSVSFYENTTDARLYYEDSATGYGEFTTQPNCNYIKVILRIDNSTVLIPAVIGDIIFNEKPNSYKDKKIHENAFSVYPYFEKGTIDTYGKNSPSVSGYPRIRSRYYIPVFPGDNLSLYYKNVSALVLTRATVTYYPNDSYAGNKISTTGFVDNGRSTTVPENAYFARIVLLNSDNSEIDPSDIQYCYVEVQRAHDINILPIRWSAPIPIMQKLNFIKGRTTHQDFAVYNDNIVEVHEEDTEQQTQGYIRVNGGSPIYIENFGHGNNCNFGVTLHGDYPYLYCPVWTEGNKQIKAYEITATTATLENTIEYTGLPNSQHVEAVVDEANERAYIFMNDDPYYGNITFYVGDLEGNLLTQGKALDFQIPIIQGMTFYNGYIYMVTGNTSITPGLYLYIFDTEGNLVNKAIIETTGEMEGVSFDPVNGNLYIGTLYQIYSDKN